MSPVTKSYLWVCGLTLAAGVWTSCGTNPGTGGDSRQPRDSDVTVATSTTLKVQLPDRSSLIGEVADIRNHMTGYHIQVESAPGDNCRSQLKYADINSYKDSAWIKVPVNSACDYILTMALGAWEDTSESPDGEDAAVTWDNRIQGIMSKNCGSCHGPDSDKGNYTSYDSAKAKAAAIFKAVASGKMPKGKGRLSQDDIDAIDAWIKAGTPEKGTALTAFEETLTKQFYATKAPVAITSAQLKGKAEWTVPVWFTLQTDGQVLGLKTAGLGIKPDSGSTTPPTTSEPVTWTKDIKGLVDSSCVKCHGPTSADGDLSTYDVAKNHFDHMYLEVMAGKMPPSGPLSQDKKDLFQKWKDGNFLEK